MEADASLRRAIDLLLSPLEQPFLRFLDICDDLHACDPSGNTLLHWAAALGNFAAAYALLQRGVAVDGCNVYGATALVVAAALCPNVATVGYLLVSHGASLNVGVDDAGGSVTVESLLESRQLGHVWAWLLDCKRGICEGDGTPLESFQGSRQLPAASGTTLSLLCSSSELRQLRVRPRNQHSPSAMDDVPSPLASAAAAISVPRPPPRDYSAPLAAAQTMHAAVSTETSSSKAVREDNIATPSARALLLQIELLESQESASRLQVEKEQLETFVSLYAAAAALTMGYSCNEDSRWSGPAAGLSADREPNGAVVGRIRAVLGERIDANGRHHLLVRYSESKENDSASEAWHFADSVMTDPVVRAHLARTYSATASGDTSDAKTPSIMTLRAAGSPLDTWEREQFEAQLRLLPRRMLQGQDGSSPLHPRSLSPYLLSPTATSPRNWSTPIVTDFLWNEQLVGHISSSSHMGHQLNGLAHASLPSPVSPSGVREEPSPLAAKERPSWRFAPGHPRQYAATAEESPPLVESSPTSRQLLLSARSHEGDEMDDVLLDVNGSSTRTAVGPGRTPTPASVKSTVYASELSFDTLASLYPAISAAPTKAPTTYSGSSVDAPTVKESGSHLTASQKVDYENYLYGAALRVLDRQHPRRRAAPDTQQSS